MKTCSGCGETKSLDQFHKSHYKCKACRKIHSAAYYQANIERMRVSAARWREADPHRSARYSAARYRAASDRIAAIKLKAGCMDCGYNEHPAALEFDHVRGVKVGNIGRMVASSRWPAIEAEMAKCEIVCANCHRIRTAKRRKSPQIVSAA